MRIEAVKSEPEDGTGKTAATVPPPASATLLTATDGKPLGVKYSAMAYGIDNVRLIAVWDGKNEPSADLDSRLVRHMVKLMRDAGGRVEQIHPHKLARYASVKQQLTAVPTLTPAVKPRSRVNGKGSSPKKSHPSKK